MRAHLFNLRGRVGSYTDAYVSAKNYAKYLLIYWHNSALTVSVQREVSFRSQETVIRAINGCKGENDLRRSFIRRKYMRVILIYLRYFWDFMSLIFHTGASVTADKSLFMADIILKHLSCVL